jgi:hypothetical protein
MRAVGEAAVYVNLRSGSADDVFQSRRRWDQDSFDALSSRRLSFGHQPIWSSPHKNRKSK